MAVTPSSMLPIGTKAIDFNLPNILDGRQPFRLSENLGTNGTVVIFMCNHCPFVIHLAKGFADLHQDYAQKGINIIGINSNDIINYPQDSPEQMVKFAHLNGLKFPYLLDEDQSVAKAYDAACTPDFYLFDSQQTLVYRGQFDDARPGKPNPVTGESLRQAIDHLLENKPIIEPQFPSLGCNIKWK